MTKPQLHRHLTTDIFNQLSKILKKLRLGDFFWIEPLDGSSRSSNFARQKVAFQLCFLFFARPNQTIKPLRVCQLPGTSFCDPQRYELKHRLNGLGRKDLCPRNNLVDSQVISTLSTDGCDHQKFLHVWLALGCAMCRICAQD